MRSILIFSVLAAGLVLTLTKCTHTTTSESIAYVAPHATYPNESLIEAWVDKHMGHLYDVDIDMITPTLWHVSGHDDVGTWIYYDIEIREDGELKRSPSSVNVYVYPTGEFYSMVGELAHVDLDWMHNKYTLNKVKMFTKPLVMYQFVWSLVYRLDKDFCPEHDITDHDYFDYDELERPLYLMNFETEYLARMK